MAGVIRICGSDGTLGPAIPGTPRAFGLVLPDTLAEFPLNETAGSRRRRNSS